MLELRLRGAHTSAFDRDVQPLFSSSGSLVSDRNVVDAVRARLAGAQRERAIETFLDAADENGNPVLIALRRSASTDWTSVTVTPGIEIQQPVRRALTQICAAFAFLLLIGGLAAYYMSRQVEGPLDAARQEVDDLSKQLLVLQEDERRRIALELHDSTAQHLVAGKLGLMQIAALADGNPAIRHAMASRVSLVVRQSAGRLLLRIRDDGRGIVDMTPAGEPQHFGVGINGMRARLRQFGGELDIKTNMRGTTLFAVVPLTEQPEVNNKPLEQTAFRAPHSRAQPATLDT